MITFRDPHPRVKAEDHLHELYQFLDGLAGDPNNTQLRRSLARVAAVATHRLSMLEATDADCEVEAIDFLQDTLDTAARTSIALIDSIDPLDTHPLSDGN